MEPNTDAANYLNEEVLAAAVDFIRHSRRDRDDDLVDVFDLFEELEKKFGDQYQISDETGCALQLIGMVAHEPGIELLGWGGVDFAWSGDTRAT